MRRFFRFVLMTLVLVVVFLISALTAMRFAIHGRETTVPSFIGLTAGEAEKQAENRGLALEYESRFYSPNIAEGRILSQLPAAGERVRRGWRVRLAQSLGPQRVAIPSVVGQSPRAAEINLTRRGLEVGSVATLSLPELPADQIVAQSPQPGAVGVTSPKVNLLLSVAGENEPAYYVMPNFVGRRFGEATSALAEAGLRVGGARVVSQNAGAGAKPHPSTPKAGAPGAPLRPIATDIILQQYPSAGQKIGAGAAVNFEVSR